MVEKFKVYRSKQMRRQNNPEFGEIHQKQKIIKIIDILMAKGLNGKRYNVMIDGEELKDTILGDSE